MEKLFKARWWDYSNRKFNLNGRLYENFAETYCQSVRNIKRAVNYAVTKLYENGDIYKGELSFGLPHNKGKLEFVKKDIEYTYLGDFLNGMKHGKGNLTSKDNLFNYEGDWANDQFEGVGTWFDHGDRYMGEFKGGKFHGNGNLYKK